MRCVDLLMLIDMSDNNYKNEIQIHIHTTAVRSIPSRRTGARTGGAVQGTGVLAGGITYYK